MTLHRAPAEGLLRGSVVPCCGRNIDDVDAWPAGDTICMHDGAHVDCPGPAPTDPVPSLGAATTTEGNHPA